MVSDDVNVLPNQLRSLYDFWALYKYAKSITCDISFITCTECSKMECSNSRGVAVDLAV